MKYLDFSRNVRGRGEIELKVGTLCQERKHKKGTELGSQPKIILIGGSSSGGGGCGGLSGVSRECKWNWVGDRARSGASMVGRGWL